MLVLLFILVNFTQTGLNIKLENGNYVWVCTQADICCIDQELHNISNSEMAFLLFDKCLVNFIRITAKHM